MTKNFHHRFKHFLAERCGVTEGDTVLVALSGGADSVALLQLLLRTGCKCVAMHCNFQLRGSESSNDETFVRQLCDTLHISCYVTQFNTHTFASTNRISIEMAARQLRYEWFETLSRKLNINRIATGHHADDAIETFFLNLLRGTGVKGLAGIAPQNGKLIRPLLFASSAEIRDYCHENSITYRTDSTNTETVFIRNKIRHQIIPLFREINPSFFHTMLHNMEYLAEAATLLDEETANAKRQLTATAGNSLLIPKNELNQHPRKRTLLFELLRSKGFSGTATANAIDALTAVPGKQFFSNTHRLVIDRYNLIAVPRSTHSETSYSIEGGQHTVDQPLHMEISIIERNSSFTLSGDTQKVHLDASRIDFPLTIRHMKAGDRFRPLGMSNFKKLSDFFTDEKLSRIDKEQTWLLLSGDNIVWIIGRRIDDRYKVTASTQTILEIQLKPVSTAYQT